MSVRSKFDARIAASPNEAKSVEPPKMTTANEKKMTAEAGLQKTTKKKKKSSAVTMIEEVTTAEQSLNRAASVSKQSLVKTTGSNVKQSLTKSKRKGTIKTKKGKNKIKQASVVEKAPARHLTKQGQKKIAATVKMNRTKMGAKVGTNIRDGK
ncbi:hypothetical protein FPOA_14022 [Fusarium poae]|uniref:Uncharacterized protein n=1 Tax=Fusarium poae TaxID=36050 RepID=A0A1B8A3E2_FUSPO|nr:hypothetical protein FPOA_14022 [Fusarium poae]